MKELRQLYILILVLLLTSCYFNEQERMFSNDVDTLLENKSMHTPTNEELEKELKKMQSELDTEGTSTKAGIKRYYIIAGSFKVPQNAFDYQQKMKSMGYEAEIIDYKDFKAVTLASFEEKQKAVAELGILKEYTGLDLWLLRW